MGILFEENHPLKIFNMDFKSIEFQFGERKGLCEFHFSKPLTLLIHCLTQEKFQFEFQMPELPEDFPPKVISTIKRYIEEWKCRIN